VNDIEKRLDTKLSQLRHGIQSDFELVAAKLLAEAKLAK
jgi:hypothetical protein